MKLRILALVSFFTVTSLFCQILDPAKVISQYLHTIYNADNGVKEVLDIVQDKNGYLWIASYDGLIRFNGREFKKYNNSNRDDLELTSARALAIDDDGALWIGSNDNGVSYFKNNEFSSFTQKDGLPNNSIRKLFVDSRNNLWVGTAAGLGLIEDGKCKVFTTYKDLNLSQVLFITENSLGEVIIGINRENGLYKYSNGIIKPFEINPIFSDKNIDYIISSTSKNIYWVLSESVLYKIENNTVLGEYKIGNYIRDSKFVNSYGLYMDNSDSLWVIADGGLIRFHNEKFDFYSTSQGLSDDMVKVVFQDYEGSLWVGTGGGLDKFVEPKFTLIDTNQGLINNGVNAVLEVGNNVWIGTNSGISIYDNKNKRFIKDDVISTINQRIRHLYLDMSGNIWISTYGDGVIKYTLDKRLIYYNSDNGLAGNKVRTVFEDSKKDIWVGTTTGLSKIDGNSITSYNLSNGMEFEYVMCLMEDSSEQLLIGTDGGGILIFKDGNFINRITKQDGLAGDVIFRFHVDDKSAVWITTGSGISKFYKDKLINFTIKNGLPTNAIFQIIEDKNNKFWVTTSDGIFSINKESFLSIEQKLDITFYDNKSGLGTGPAATAWGIIDRYENLWIPTYNGVALLEPESNKINSVPPRVVIEDEIIIDNISYYKNDNITLNPDSRRVIFNVSALSYQVPDKVVVQYMLEGFDETWLPKTTKNDVLYTNLSPGVYKLLVKAYNNDGIESDNIAEFSFTKKPHFYETPLFIIVVVFLSLSMLLLVLINIHNIRTRVLKNKILLQEKEIDFEKKAKLNEMKLTKSYSRFVPHEFLQLLNKDSIQSVQLGDQIEMKMAILVFDIRSFTTISETLTPEENFNFLNSFLAITVPIIRNNGGVIDKYIGDAVMALFPHSVEAAVKTALELQNEVAKFNLENRCFQNKFISIGIGIHFGSIMVGTIGETNRMDATVISDAVNVCFRLESLTKEYSESIIISESVKNIIEDTGCFNIKFINNVVVKGKTNSLNIYSVI